MSNLKQLINHFVDDHFIDSSASEKSLLKCLALKKTFDLPYYKDIYYASSLAMKNDGSTEFSTNEYNLGSNTIHPYLHSFDYPYPDQDDFKNVDKYLVSPAICSRLNTFIDIVKNHSETIGGYTDKIVEAHKGDPEFISTLKSFDLLIPGYEHLFFNDNTNYLFKHKNVSPINSQLCKNETSISFSRLNIFLPEKVEADWEKNKTERFDAITKMSDSFEDISNAYYSNKQNLDTILNHVKSEKPYLFEHTASQPITFSYYETEGDIEGNGYKDFALSKDYCIDPSILAKNDVSISDVYMLKPDKEKYETLDEVVFKHLFKKDDDISKYLTNAFYGLTFFNESALRPSKRKKSYLLAKANDDVVGFISFHSLDAQGESIVKDIGYVSVKDNFRGTGLTEKLYDKLACLISQNGNVLTNDRYTDEGSLKLPRLKNRVRAKHPELLMIDLELSQWQNSTKSEIAILDLKAHVNAELREALISFSQQPDKLKPLLGKIALLHKEKMDYIDNNSEKFLQPNKEYLSNPVKKEFTSDFMAALSDMFYQTNSHKPSFR